MEQASSADYDYLRVGVLTAAATLKTPPDRRSCCSIYCLGSAAKLGVPLMGYFYWSLEDNYEWCEGWEAKFGLFKTDHKHLRWLIARNKSTDAAFTPRHSALLYREVVSRRLTETTNIAALKTV